MPPPAEVVGLIKRFEEQRDDYRSGRYNEAQLREDFLNPFFKALGWDVHNERGWSEAYREVIHEAAIKVGGRTKAHDKTVIHRQIEATDRQIDRLVYELYNLTDEEIAIVEEATGKND